MKLLNTANNFGATDADNDLLLEATFEDHKAYLDLWNMEKFLIVGKKGSGKTAIFKRILRSRGHDCFTFGHTFKDYPWHHHSKQARTGIPDFDKYTHSWKYLILLTASKILLNQDNSIPFDESSMEAIARLENFVVDTYGSRDLDVTQIFSPRTELKLNSNFKIKTGFLEAGLSPESLPIEQLPTVVQEVNQNLLQHVLQSLNPSHRYYICFDQLDLDFDPLDDEYLHRMIGLLLACRDINIAARKEGKKLLVAVFLRDDIYETLKFGDKNKLTENHVSLIEWDTTRTNNTLRGLMEKRFTTVLGEDTESVSWEDVFDEGQEMSGRQAKYQHIVDRTFLRPRDVIKFVNAVLDQYKQRMFKLDASSERVKFTNTDINAARIEYSEYLRRETDDEVHPHLPDYQKYFDLLRALGVWQFDRTPFEDIVQKRPDLVAGEQPITILEKLFSFSLIGYYRAGGRGYGGSGYIFLYKDPLSKFDPTAQLFRVHPGLIESLNLKKSTLQADS